MQFLGNTNIDFVGRRKIAAGVSLLLIVAGVVSLIAHGGPHLSIDFKGGTLVELRIEPALDVAQVRDALDAGGVSANQVTTFGEPEEILIYLDTPSGERGIEQGQRTVREILSAAFPEPATKIELRREETVGPKIGGELKTGAINSIFVALVLIVLYITVRFVFQFGLAAVITLVHDVVITLGLFSLLNKEISLTIVAAFLTIIGYSLNDTIVVFDRIRENMRLRRKESYEAVVNRSINETLSRTIITSLTTFLVALILFMTGGAVIHDFAFALVIGVVVGTYSSIFVASPILIAWYNWRSSDRKRARNPKRSAKAVSA